MSEQCWVYFWYSQMSAALSHLFSELFEVLLLRQALLGKARLADEQHLHCGSDGASGSASEAPARSCGAAP